MTELTPEQEYELIQEEKMAIRDSCLMYGTPQEALQVLTAGMNEEETALMEIMAGDLFE